MNKSFIIDFKRSIKFICVHFECIEEFPIVMDLIFTDNQDVMLKYNETTINQANK